MSHLTFLLSLFLSILHIFLPIICRILLKIFYFLVSLFLHNISILLSLYLFFHSSFTFDSAPISDQIYHLQFLKTFTSNNQFFLLFFFYKLHRSSNAQSPIPLLTLVYFLHQISCSYFHLSLPTHNSKSFSNETFTSYILF